ncbi:MAG: tetratricopeptide repeat protein [Gemmataceae bacterium]
MSHPSRRKSLLVLGVVLSGLVALAWPQLRASYAYLAAERALHAREPARAKPHLDVCLATWPTHPRVQLLAAQLARWAGFYEEADRRITLYQELGGDRDTASLERVLLEVQQGRLSLGADFRIQEWIDTKHPRLNEILEVASEAYVRGYRLPSARYCLDAWIERQPDSVTARLRRGWVFERLFQATEAEQDYRALLERHPDHQEARLRLAQLLLLNNEPAEAVEHLERLARHDVTPPMVAALAAGLRALGQADQAHERLSAALVRFPREGPLWLERGRAAIDLRRMDDAERDLRKAAELQPDDYQVNYQLAQFLRRAGQKEEAERTQARADRIDADQKRMYELSERLQGRPYDPDLRSQMGQLMLRNGEPREGVLWLESALRIDPAFRPAHKALAEHFEQTRQAARAAEHRRFLSAGGSGDGKQP